MLSFAAREMHRRWYDRTSVATGEGRSAGEDGEAAPTSSPQPAFYFGHGLTYTEFSYSDVSTHVPPREYAALVTASLVNVGSESGCELAQLYVSWPKGGLGADEPPAQLRGFERICLKAGQDAVINFEITLEALQLYVEDKVRSCSRGLVRLERRGAFDGVAFDRVRTLPADAPFAFARAGTRANVSTNARVCARGVRTTSVSSAGRVDCAKRRVRSIRGTLCRLPRGCGPGHFQHWNACFRGDARRGCGGLRRCTLQGWCCRRGAECGCCGSDVKSQSLCLN